MDTTTNERRHSLRGFARFTVGALVVVMVAALTAPVTAADPATIMVYRIDDLGTLSGDTNSFAFGINASGQVVGVSMGSAGTRAFVFRDGVGMSLLAAPAGRPVTVARSINDVGNIAGSASVGGTDLGHAVRWTNGVPRDLGTLEKGSYSEAESINNSGATVGYSYTDGGSFNGIHAFMFTDPGGLADLTPGIMTAYGKGINTSGEITGYRNGRAFRWAGGMFTDLGVPDGFMHSFGFAINDDGMVAGHVITASGNEEKIVRYTDGTGMVVIGGVGEHNRAFGINGRGDVVGQAGRSLSRAFLYTDQEGMVDLNTRIDGASGWVLRAAYGINDAGQVAAWGFNKLTGATHALRLTPGAALQPPPAPSGLVARAWSPSNIDLGWVDNSSTESGFRIERRTGIDPFAVIATTAANSTSFIDSELRAGTMYEYRLLALNDAGQSTYSNIASATTWPSVDVTPPSVQFVVPTDGAMVSGRVAVKIVASDNVGIASVRFLVDGVITCQTTSAVLTCGWNTRRAGIGTHVLTAMAADGSGNSSTQTISVLVVRSLL